MTFSLTQLGARPAILADLDLDCESFEDVARVATVHRDVIDVITTTGPERIRHAQVDDPLDRPTVGDFILIDRALERPARVLARTSLFKRKAAGTDVKVQLIAANVDTGFIVTSCNADFSPARLERYLVMVRKAGAEPVVLLTKADLADPDAYLGAARDIAHGALVEAVDARRPDSLERLSPWIGPGQTAALIGSSGVGKTTLVETLTGVAAHTGEIRENDAKGRHTTRVRSLHALAAGGWIIDTPGLRELALTDVDSGLAATFDDLAALEAACRFSNCGHTSEPGCAILEALESGALASERWARFEKLKREAARNDASLARRRAADKARSKFYKQVSAQSRRSKGAD